MKQLLHCKKEATILALNERSFVHFSNTKRLIELLPVECKRNDLTENPIQAVAVEVDDDNAFWCAVSREDKTLLVYRVENKESKEETPTTVHHTCKRVGCMCFARVEGLLVLLAGDFTGDAWALSLENKDDKRLLLGHTASMLTGIHYDANRKVLLTSDRDEKVRVTAFPETTILKGFLLGHAAYVSSLDVARDGTNPICVTCSGGDGTVRVWNYETMKELVSWTATKETNTTPSRVAMDPKGEYIAVIYDQSDTMDILQLQQQEKGQYSLTLAQSIQCSKQPLAVSFTVDNNLIVTVQDPIYLNSFLRKENQNASVVFQLVELPPGLAELRQVGKDKTIQMPDSVLEKDKEGLPNMQKKEEKRGGAALPENQKPWNKTERVEIAKERNKRHKRRRVERKKAELKDG